MPSGTGIAPPRCHPPPDGGTLRHVNNSLPGPVSEGSVHGNGSRQPDNWLSALAEPFVTVLAHGNGVIDSGYPHSMLILTYGPGKMPITFWYKDLIDVREATSLPASPKGFVAFQVPQCQLLAGSRFFIVRFGDQPAKRDQFESLHNQ